MDMVCTYFMVYKSTLSLGYHLHICETTSFPLPLKRTPFSTPARALVKTMTMTTGEFEYDSIFRQPSNPLEDAGDDLQFPSVSYILWIVFLVLMPILLTNLLVGHVTVT